MGEEIETHIQLKLVNAFETNNEIVLKTFYNANYYKTERLVLSNSGSKEQAKDIYQEAFITVWKNIKQNKFQPKSKTNINGYLYQIAKNKWMDVLRSSKFKKTTLIGDTKFQFTDNEEEYNNDFQEEKLEKTMEAFKNLGQSCKQLLTTFYFDKKSLRDIALELKLGEASVRNKKYRCMEKLRTIVLASNL